MVSRLLPIQPVSYVRLRGLSLGWSFACLLKYGLRLYSPVANGATILATTGYSLIPGKSARTARGGLTPLDTGVKPPMNMLISYRSMVGDKLHLVVDVL